ncbi:unnamed protein product [Heligmosomoides polygyrus]|uniref:CCHC-type domain-containing protein n=1 Tax=Heligmosomoides polygyrus TaxID=6339 RepID=A0A183GQ44_HELPZ|nr:unnamed protein product [Heligmosomoides polygyrus]
MSTPNERATPTTDSLLEEIEKLRSQQLRLLQSLPACPTPEELTLRLGARYENRRLGILRWLILLQNREDKSVRFDNSEVFCVPINRVLSTIQNIRLQFQLARAELAALSLYHDILIATETLSQDEWNSWMQRTHLDAEDQPLIMDKEQLDQMITQNLEFLGNYSCKLVDLRWAACVEHTCDTTFEPLDEEQSMGYFETEVLRRLSALEAQLMGEPHNYLQHRGKLLSSRKRNRNEKTGPISEDTQKETTTRTHEQHTISNNAEFMDAIEFDEDEHENAQPEDLLVIVDEVNSDDEPERNVVLRQPSEQSNNNTKADAHHNADDHLVGEYDGNEHYQAHTEADVQRVVQPIPNRNVIFVPDDDDVVIIPATENAHHENARATLEARLRQAIETKRAAEHRLQMLRRQRICPARRFELGSLAKPPTDTLPCVYCEAMGAHYSDSCPEIRDAATRSQLIEDNNRCRTCLLPQHPPGKSCKKKKVECRHCRETGHHPSLCPEPERGELLRRHIKRELETIERNERLVNEITAQIQAQQPHQQ